MCACSKKAVFFCTISVGINCRDGSNTFLFTEQQDDQLIRFVLMIWSFNFSYYRFYPISTTDFRIFYRFILQIIVPDSRLSFSVICRPTILCWTFVLNEKRLFKSVNHGLPLYCTPQAFVIIVSNFNCRLSDLSTKRSWHVGPYWKNFQLILSAIHCRDFSKLALLMQSTIKRKKNFHLIW